MKFVNLIMEDSIEIWNAKKLVIVDDIAFIKTNYQMNDKATTAEIKDMANYYSERIEKLKLKEISLGNNIKRLKKLIEDNSSQIKNLGNSVEVPTGEIVLELDIKENGIHNIEVRYFSKQASWLPFYDVRAVNTNSPLDISFKANIKQDTREDWQNVKLILSSETPNVDKTLIKLQPYFINFNTYPPQYKSSTNLIKGKVRDVNGEPLIGASILVVGTSIGSITDIDGRFELPILNPNSSLKISYVGFNDKILQANISYMDIAMEESALLDEVVVTGLGAISSKTAGSQPKVRGNRSNETVTFIDGIRTEGTLPEMIYSNAEFKQNISGFEYELDEPFTIKSAEKNRIIDISNYTVDATYQYTATPKIRPEVFINAFIKDWDNDGLIDGQANIYYEDTYIGKTVLAMNSEVDSINISLGIDQNIKVRRDKEKEANKKSFLSGKKHESKSWILTVKNFKTIPVTLEMFDQIPVSTNEDIEVEFKNESKANIDKESGILRWSLNVSGKSEEKIKFGYKVKFPSDKPLYVD